MTAQHSSNQAKCIDSIQIQKADISDLEAILLLQKRCYRENAERYDDFQIQPLMQTLEDVQKEFIKATVLKAVDGESVVGSIRGFAENETGHICKVIVHPDYQNRGIGSRLVTAMESCFQNAERFELFTGFRDEKNLYLYQKLGYRKFKKKNSGKMVFIYLEKRKEVPDA
ncbi:MAG: GNAT family N-acetyltransferase [Chitinispirillaceae bacterium]